MMKLLYREYFWDLWIQPMSTKVAQEWNSSCQKESDFLLPSTSSKSCTFHHSLVVPQSHQYLHYWTLCNVKQLYLLWSMLLSSFQLVWTIAEVVDHLCLARSNSCLLTPSTQKQSFQGHGCELWMQMDARWGLFLGHKLILLWLFDLLETSPLCLLSKCLLI